jgi:glucose-6-phosphate isomerase
VRRRGSLEPSGPLPSEARLLSHADAVARRVSALAASRFIARMFRGDPSLWSSDPAARRVIRNRLGWLRSPERMLREVPRLEAFATEAREDGIRDVVLLGMGGSSLCVEVFRRVLPSRPGSPRIGVLDSTVPAAVRRVEATVDPSRTLFVVSSKSGTTTETAALQSHFWGLMRRRRGRLASRHFVAITDPGTPLSAEAAARGYRATFHNPPDIGGRYSALSYFGLVPAVLGGLGVASLLRSAIAMLERCGPEVEAKENPGLLLGAALGVLARRGRDKVVLLADPRLKPIGPWIEQLLAESTGKEGRGLVPIDAPTGAAALRATLAGSDRVVAEMTLEDDRSGRARARRGAAGVPSVVLPLGDRSDLGALMVQWEIATAVAGSVLGINPFDEPNVAESKANTASVLEELEATGRLREERPALVEGSASVVLGGLRPPARRRLTLPGVLRALLRSRRRGDYVAVLAYVDPAGRAARSALEGIRSRLLSLTGCAVTVGCGPRYLHSTGQLHKGGPNRGLFVEIVPADAAGLLIPGRPYDFETLKQAQALGDFLSLQRRGRRILRLRSTAGAAAVLRALAAALQRAGRRA